MKRGTTNTPRTKPGIGAGGSIARYDLLCNIKLCLVSGFGKNNSSHYNEEVGKTFVRYFLISSFDNHIKKQKQ